MVDTATTSPCNNDNGQIHVIPSLPGVGFAGFFQDQNLPETHAFRQRQSREELIKDFECCCCQEIMIDPTTLNCGHSLCRHCLAKWYFQSKKKKCPQCNQAWTGHPRVNLVLRNTIETLCASEIEEREHELSSIQDDNKKLIAQFDQQMSDTGASGEDHIRGFCSGLIFSLLGVLVLYLIWYWRHSEYNLLVNKPIQHWRFVEVEHWLEELGDWAKPYAEYAKEAKIDGTLLMSIAEDNIDSVLNITTPLHVRAVLSSLNLAKNLGVKPPQNLWDFKSLYRGQTLFLLYGMKDFPRVTILFSYFFAYDEVFVPFVQYACRNESVVLEDYQLGKLPPPTSSQWREFLVKLVILPYYLIISFAWHWLDGHYWTSRLIIVNCAALTVLELISVWKLANENWIGTWSRLSTYIRSWLSMGLFAAVWPLIPVIFADCIFYIALFYSPFLNIERLYKEFRR